MSTSRRSFIASILAAGYAPAAIGSGVLMPVRQLVAQPIFRGTPGLYNDLIIVFDDPLAMRIAVSAEAMQFAAWTDRLMYEAIAGKKRARPAGF